MDRMVEEIWEKICNPHYTFIIAEAGVNHNGCLKLARKLIEVAARAGVDAVKFQTFKAEHIAIPEAEKADYQKECTAIKESQWQMLKRLELSPDDHKHLKSFCEEKGLIFLSSPFDEESADYLEKLDVPCFKVPSGEITNLPFLAHLARKGRPLIVSTGMATIGEIEQALEIMRETGNEHICLLHCTSSYPAPATDCNLRAINTLRQAFQLPVGYSDHTEGIAITLAAVALGASVIEKHFTLDKQMPGPDHRASLEPEELSQLVKNIRLIEKALGTGRKWPTREERKIALTVRKSIVTTRDVSAGEIITSAHVALKRPGTGLPPSLLPHVIGRRARLPIPKDTLITWEMLL